MNVSTDTTSIDEQVDQLIDRYRDRCLWFVRKEYYPDTTEARLKMLKYIELYGDRNAFIKSRELTECLLRHSSAKSAG